MDRSAKIPAHVAVIMDGNGRWAASRGLERVRGHVEGVGAVRASIRAARAAGVRYLTLYAFSTENWGRPAGEVGALMELLTDSIERETPALAREGIRFVVIGGREELSEKVRRSIEGMERATAGGDNLTVVLAVNYSSRSELARAAGRMVARAAAGEAVEVTERALAGELYTAGIPDPDLVIRTGGERRLSNFLLWQAAYAELYFTPVMWPDFGEKEFAEALAEFANRERRFGKIK